MRAERTGRVGVEWTMTPPTERASAGPPREEAAVRLLGLVRRTRWAGPAWALEPQMARAPAGALRGTVAVRLLGWVRRERRAGPARALAPPTARSPLVLPMARAPLTPPMARVSAMALGVVPGPQGLGAQMGWAGQVLALALVSSMVRASAAVGPEAPEREGMRRGVPGQKGPRMEVEPVLPRGGWQTWAVHLAIHHLQSEPPVWRP